MTFLQLTLHLGTQRTRFFSFPLVLCICAIPTRNHIGSVALAKPGRRLKRAFYKLQWTVWTYSKMRSATESNHISLMACQKLHLLPHITSSLLFQRFSFRFQMLLDVFISALLLLVAQGFKQPRTAYAKHLTGHKRWISTPEASKSPWDEPKAYFGLHQIE